MGNLLGFCGVSGPARGCIKRTPRSTSVFTSSFFFTFLSFNMSFIRAATSRLPQIARASAKMAPRQAPLLTRYVSSPVLFVCLLADLCTYIIVSSPR